MLKTGNKCHMINQGTFHSKEASLPHSSHGDRKKVQVLRFPIFEYTRDRPIMWHIIPSYLPHRNIIIEAQKIRQKTKLCVRFFSVKALTDLKPRWLEEFLAGAQLTKPKSWESSGNHKEGHHWKLHYKNDVFLYGFDTYSEIRELQVPMWIADMARHGNGRSGVDDFPIYMAMENLPFIDDLPSGYFT